MNRLCLLTVLFFLCALNIHAQRKAEREERVELEEFPKKAQDVVRQLPEASKRLRLYKETDGEKVSFEAKFKFKKQLVSLEFNTSGVVEDIEIEMSKNDLKNYSALFNAIEMYLNSKGKKHKIIRIQKQYIFSEQDEMAFLLSVLNKTYDKPLNYELIVQIKTDKDWVFSEILFNESGKLLLSRDIKPSSYGHILY